MQDLSEGAVQTAQLVKTVALVGSSFHELFVHNPLPMWIYDPDSLRFLEVNESAMRHYGYARDEFLQMSVTDIRPPEDVPRLLAHLQQRPATHSGFRRSRGWRHRRRNGALIWVDAYSHDFWYVDRNVRLVMVHDVTELKDFSDRLEQQSAMFGQLFHSSPEAIVMLDEQDRVVDANAAFERLFLYPLAEARGRIINELIVPPGKGEEASSISQAVLNKRTVERDTVRRRKDGSLVDVAALGYPITVGERQVGVFAIYREITDAKRIAAQLAFHATHDTLTGLINRHEFERILRERLRHAARRGIVLYLEVDQLKVVNDGYGREAGDRLLVELSGILRTQVHETDCLARLGGDEFGVLLDEVPAETGVEVAARIVRAVGAYRFRWQERQMAVSMSGGAVVLDGGIVELGELLNAADAACHAAKVRGRNRVELFRADDPDLLRFRGELFWGARILEALDRGSFALYHQRIVPLNGAVSGPSRYEILLRVIDASGTAVPPGMVMAAAERYALMPALDRHVIERVLRELQRRRAFNPRLDEVVCVNVAGSSLSDESFSRHVRALIEQSGVPARHLCFEITETSAIRNLSRALAFIGDMRALGCGIALDDFGSGMSSFAYLKSFNVDYLKIDGSFVRDIVHDAVDSATAEAINKVAHVKGLQTIAECVEDDATLTRLRELGVDFAQGFHLHRPAPWEHGRR